MILLNFTKSRSGKQSVLCKGYRFLLTETTKHEINDSNNNTRIEWV